MAHSAVKKCIEDLLTAYHELNATSVDELNEEPSALEFMRYVARNRPFVVRGGALDWQACKTWTADKLAEILGEEPVRVAVTPQGNADSVVQTQNGPVFVKPYETTIPFKDALATIQLQSASLSPRSRPTYYIQPQNNSLSAEYPLLASAVPTSIPFARIALLSAPDAVNFWLGNSQSTTGLHRDNYENIYAQIRGRKVFTLLPPVAAPCINEQDLPAATYVPRSGIAQEEQNFSLEVELDDPPSSVPFATWDPASPIINATPFSHLAQPLKVTLDAGDMLYLPALWYHKVEQENSVDGISVSVNYWYDMEFSGGFWSTSNFVRDLARRI